MGPAGKRWLIRSDPDAAPVHPAVAKLVPRRHIPPRDAFGDNEALAHCCSINVIARFRVASGGKKS